MVFLNLGMHSSVASVIGAVSCHTDCEWVFFFQMKLGCDSDLPVWQVAVVVLSVGGEDLRRRSAVVSRTVELPVCAVLWDQMLAARAVCATRSQEVSLRSFCPHFHPQ